MRGLFVTLEGGEGCGKTTQAEILKSKLTDFGIPHELTKEPGGTKAGAAIREFLLHTKRKLSGLEELILFEADRIIHVDEIEAQLADGKIVVCDRFIDSTVAYQSYGRGVPLYAVKEFNTIGQLGLVPDVTYYLRIDPGIGVQRALERKGRNSRFDLEKAAFHLKVFEGFDIIAKSNSSRIVVVNGMQPRELVANDIWDDLKVRLEER